MLLKFIAILLVLGLFIIGTPRLLTSLYARTRIFPSINQYNNQKIAIIFGAGLWKDGRPTTVLKDRVTAAAMLFQNGKVEKLLMSGENAAEEYNEPLAMQQYALSLGIPFSAIVIDNAGRRTYDTCYRAKHIFGVNQAILVSQSFHLPRAIYTCNMLGITSSGYPSDFHKFRKLTYLYWSLREFPATLVAMWEIYVSHPIPTTGDPEPIFPPEVP